MPRPIGAILESRAGAPLALFLGILLIASGILTVRWSNGLPAIAVNQDKAKAVKQEVEGRFGSLGNGLAEQATIARFGALLSGANSRDDYPLTNADQNDATPLLPLTGSPPTTASFPVPSPDAASGANPPATITIASFNIQVLHFRADA
jgi:hypothetical protein